MSENGQTRRGRDAISEGVMQLDADTCYRALRSRDRRFEGRFYVGVVTTGVYCRPDAAPGTPAWFGTSATVSRALRLISEGALDGDDAEALASRLGVGTCHL